MFGSGEELQEDTDDSGIWNDDSKTDTINQPDDNKDIKSNDDEIDSDEIDDLFG